MSVLRVLSYVYGLFAACFGRQSTVQQFEDNHIVLLSLVFGITKKRSPYQVQNILIFTGACENIILHLGSIKFRN